MTNNIEESFLEIESAINSIALESALKNLIELATKLSLLRQSGNHEMLLGSKCLDQYAERIGALALKLLADYKKPKLFNDSLVIYLATGIYDLGGHTRVMMDFVRAQPNRHHILVITHVLDLSKELQRTALSWFEALGVEVIWIEDQLLLAKLLAIQSLLMERKPSTVFLFNHHQDAVLVAGCQPGLAKRFIYYHHCDHAFAFGVFVPHFNHIDLSPKIFHTCREQLGIDNYYLPLAIKDRDNLKRELKLFQSGSLRTASSGFPTKYDSSENEDYFYMVAVRLAELPGTHLHIGLINDSSKINRLQTLCSERGVDFSRVIYLPRVDSLWDTLCEWNVDLYIPSFPIGGGRAAIEVMGAGIPIAVRDTGSFNELNGIEIYYPEVYRWNHVDELIRLLCNLDSVCLSDASKKSRRWYEKFHRFDQLELSLANLPDKLPNIDVPNSPSLSVSFLSIDRTDSDAPTAASKLSAPVKTDQDSGQTNVRTIAFYLPQFHPIPENDQWWGKGFTEWRNVTKATPLFEGHYQPHLPSDLGFYDLRLPEVLEEQAELARRYGIYGFCYYYYWFNGHRFLETPIDNMLKSDKPDFPFCLCWANENWTRRWDGGENDILMEQTYNEANAHQIIRDLLPFLLDHRYIRVNNKPVLLVYRTDIIPNTNDMLAIWRQEAKAAGLLGLYLVRVESFYTCNPYDLGFDATCEFPPHTMGAPDVPFKDIKFISRFSGVVKDYGAFTSTWLNRSIPSYKLFRSVMVSWDNTARRGDNATVFINSSPENYRNWLKKIVADTYFRFQGDERLVFINAWNEWAEGCHLEPDLKYGHAYLEATARALEEGSKIKIQSIAIDRSQSDYPTWRDRHRWSTSALARLAEQVVSSVAAGMGVHLLMVAAAGEGNASADTIDTLAAQGSEGWRLTVFSPASCPNPLFETFPALAWIQITAAEKLSSDLDQAVALSPVDWFMVCAPGIRLEPPFISLVLAASAQHPDWRCLYLDEERVDGEGHSTSPRLKPDANLELLRSSAYVDHAVLVNRALWPALNRYLAALPRAFAFDAALRAMEIGGEAALGHIDELAVALPETVDANVEEWLPVATALIEGHLSRFNQDAVVRPGFLEGSFFIDYSLSSTPFVSIIIPTRDRLDLIQPCIESLLEKTAYPHYEVIIIDNLSSHRATLEYLAQLPTRDQRVRVISYPKEYNYSAINNLAARQAAGDFLVLLNNDTVILQDNWLSRLVSIGLREDVGVVGCRLIYPNKTIQHAGMIIGMSGIAHHVGIDLPMSDSGYMGRLQLTQNFLAVTAACLLVCKDLFFSVGGLDEKEFPVLFNDADLCLKISQQGYRIVWTPYVTLIHHGNASLNSESDIKKRDSILQKNAKSRTNFIKKWISPNSGDPAYHRYLSLRSLQWIIDGTFDVPWHPDFESLPRIVAQAPDEIGSGQYRMIEPLKELADNGRICHFQLPPTNSDKRFMPSVAELVRAKPTVLFLQNAFSEFELEHLQDYAELLPNLFRVFGQDDIVFSVPQKSGARKHFGRDTKTRVRRGVSLCHRAIVTTEPIAEAMRGMVGDIRVVPNYLERSRWGNLQPPGNQRRKPRVGWAGAQQHQGDLEFILPVVEATANEVDWIFMGLCLPKLRRYVAEVHDFVVFDQYPAGLAALDLDLAIAPLELNRFNSAKSNLRLLEYGAVGYPVIATDILPYRNAPVTRVPNNHKAWIDAIRSHIHDLDATRAAGEQLREWVLSHWMLDQHLDEWMKALLPD